MVTFHGCDTQFLVRINLTPILQLCFLVNSTLKLVPGLLHPVDEGAPCLIFATTM